jgi:hypothetical protein
VHLLVEGEGCVVVCKSCKVISCLCVEDCIVDGVRLLLDSYQLFINVFNNKRWRTSWDSK